MSDFDDDLKKHFGPWPEEKCWGIKEHRPIEVDLESTFQKFALLVPANKMTYKTYEHLGQNHRSQDIDVLNSMYEYRTGECRFSAKSLKDVSLWFKKYSDIVKPSSGALNMLKTKELVASLDVVADRLESKGMVREAAEVDVISNTLEAFSAPSRQLFDEYGHFKGRIPTDAVKECSGPGPADEAVKRWRKKLNFEVPREKAILYLIEYGAWTIDALKGMDDDDLAEKVLWIACGDIKESGRWDGMIH